MKRAYYENEALSSVFKTIKLNIPATNKELASELSISPRTLNDWMNGRYGVPFTVIQLLIRKYHVEFPPVIELLDEKEMRARSGRIGGLKTFQKYGNIGTEEGRRKGGMVSLATHKKKHTGFILRNNFTSIRKSKELAEFIGSMMGDGNMTKYQARITLNKNDDALYADYLCKSAERLFQYKPTIRIRRNTKELVMSGIDLVEKLQQNGLVIGNKVKQNIGIPKWIQNNIDFSIACIRGLFDTDGSFYFDTHMVGKKLYSSANIAITTYSNQLFSDICKILHKLHIDHTIHTKHRIAVRKKEQIIKFFRIIQPCNAKHTEKYKRSLEV